MKKGIIILSIGLLFTVFSTVRLLVEEHVTDPGKTRAAQVGIHHQIWEPLIGAVIVMIGVGIYVVGRKNNAASHAGSV
ncbi:hypothetical protein WSM22_45920 [Cytophagales bacterium WSM2-2]|nr:hypothetical protein WSM22_45920 [Cytophagales bacterium WSM2-2]